MWKEEFEKEFGSNWNDDKVEGYPQIEAFIETQLEKLIEEIPDELSIAREFGNKLSVVHLKQQLRAKWLGKEEV